MRLPVRAFPTLAAPIALVGLALIIGSCGGGGTEPRTPGRIEIAPGSLPVIPAGGSLVLSANVFDTKGQAMSGQTVAFSTSAPNIATVSAEGRVSSVGPVGSVTITASLGTVQGTIGVTVVAGPSTSITRTSPDPGAVPPGGTAGDSVRFLVKDAFGNPHAQETVTFSVTAGGGRASPSTAQTDAGGRAATVFVTGSAEGTNTLTATVGGVTPSSLSLTTAAGAVSVSSVAPSPMTPGLSVTITGTGFDPSATGDAVTIDGQAAGVISATATQIVISIPSTLPCTPSHQAIVQVTANGASAIGHQTLKMGGLQTLGVGSSVVLANQADVNCVELSPASGRYEVNVLNSSTVPTAITPFRFAGATTIPAGTTLAPRVVTLRQSLKSPAFSREVTGIEKLASMHSAMHLDILESNRMILTRMKSGFRHKAPKSTSPSLRASLAAAPPAVGDVRAFRIFKPSTAVGASATCNDFAEISARVAYVGTKAIVYEDVAAPLAGQMDDKFIALGQEFDTSMYPSDANTFGDPLLTDVDTDNDQHLNMVFTPTMTPGLAGFVLSCDFFPRNASNQVSNFGENFYARVPRVAGTGFTTDNPEAFVRTMRGTIVHEVKHIASYGAHLENPAATSFEESWLEEGMAMVAEEVWARDRVYPGAMWKGNMIYQSTLFCDVRPTNPACAGRPFVMFDHYSRLYTYLDLPGTGSLFGRASDGDFVFYGASWSFIRYNVDRFAGSEETYLRGITSASATGIANIAQQSGADPTQILGNWSLALLLDGNGATAGNADVNLSSWDMRDIYAGMNTDFPQESNFPKRYPLVPLGIQAGDFSIDNVGIHGGSFAPYELTGVPSSTTRAIGVSAGASGPAPAGFRLVIARIQ